MCSLGNNKRICKLLKNKELQTGGLFFLFSPCVLFIDLVYMSTWFCRNLEDDVCEMKCTLAIDHEVLKAPLGYKYVIYSPKVTKCDDCYEKLHSLVDKRSDDPNRCLWITPQERDSGGTCIFRCAYHKREYENVFLLLNVETRVKTNKMLKDVCRDDSAKN